MTKMLETFFVGNFQTLQLPNTGLILKKYMKTYVVYTDIIIFRTGRREQVENPSTTSQYNNSAQNSLNTAILNNSCQSPLMLYMSSLQVPILRDCCKEIIASFESDDIDVAINVPQHSVDWKKMRKHRITGSRCYEIFTYSKDDWKNKALKYFNQPSLNNKFVKHGLQFESRARDVFIKISKMDVVECGLIIPEANKWLGYSPDGIIFFNGQPLYLLEIKCLFEGMYLYQHTKT